MDQASANEYIHRDHTEKLRILSERIDRVEATVSALRVTDAGTAERIEFMIKLIQETDKKIDGLLRRIEHLEEDVKNLRERPSRMWDGFLLSLISAGIGAILAMILRR